MFISKIFCKYYIFLNKKRALKVENEKNKNVTPLNEELVKS